jgi:MFS family permease
VNGRAGSKRSRGTVAAALAQRDYRRFFLGGLLNQIGMWCFNIAAGLLVYEMTRSTLLVGAINFALFAGTVLLAPLAGGAADRFDRRRMLMATQAFAAVVIGQLALLTWFGRVTPAVVIASAAAFGLALAFGTPALQALVPLLVDPEDLAGAMALNGVMFNLARAVGPALGAFAAEWLGFAPVFVMTTVAFAGFVGTLALLRPRPQHPQLGPRIRFVDSVRTVRGNRRVLAMLVAAMGVSMSSDPAITLAPELVQDVFGERELYVGLFVGAFGVGAVLAAFALTDFLRRYRRVLVGAMLVQGVAVVGVGLAPGIHWSMVAIGVSGAAFLTAMTRSTTRLHTEIPDEVRGRVMALWSLAFLGSRPVAALVDGAVAELAGARTAAVVMSLPVLVTAVVVHRMLPPMTPDAAAEERPVAADAPVLPRDDD